MQIVAVSIAYYHLWSLNIIMINDAMIHFPRIDLIHYLVYRISFHGLSKAKHSHVFTWGIIRPSLTSTAVLPYIYAGWIINYFYINVWPLHSCHLFHRDLQYNELADGPNMHVILKTWNGTKGQRRNSPLTWQVRTFRCQHDEYVRLYNYALKCSSMSHRPN